MGRLLLAVSRTRFGVLTVAITYLIGVGIGLIMAVAGNRFALGYRDKIVKEAGTTDIIQSLDRGNPGRAAALDAAGNLGASLGATIAGYSVVAGYEIAAFRGWVGGLVGVDDNHRSRLGEGAFYYLTTLFLRRIGWHHCQLPNSNWWLNGASDLKRMLPTRLLRPRQPFRSSETSKAFRRYLQE